MLHQRKMGRRKFIQHSVIATAGFALGACNEMIEPTLDLMNGLVAWYPLSGQANDISGNNHHVIVHGAEPCEACFDEQQGAYYFDGVDDYLDLGPSNHFTIENAFSVSLWLNPESPGPILSNYHGGTIYRGQFNFNYDNNTDLYIDLGYQRGEGLRYRATRRGMLTYGQWQHIVLTYDGKNQKGNKAQIYINTVEAGPYYIPHEHPRSSILSISEPLWLMGYPGRPVSKTDYPDGAFMRGTLADVRIYRRSLNKEEVKTLYLM